MLILPFLMFVLMYVTCANPNCFYFLVVNGGKDIETGHFIFAY